MGTKLTAPKITYVVIRQCSGGFTTDLLRVAEYQAQSVAERLAGTIDNKDRYGTTEAAQSMGRLFAAMLADGHTQMYDWEYGRDRSVSISYQVHRNPEAERPDYCEPCINFPEKIHAVDWAVALVKRLGKRIENKIAKANGRDHAAGVTQSTISQLQDVTDALDAIGAVRCEMWQDPARGYSWTYRVPVKVNKKTAKKAA